MLFIFIFFMVVGGGMGDESMGYFGSVLTEPITCWVGPDKKILFA